MAFLIRKSLLFLEGEIKPLPDGFFQNWLESFIDRNKNQSQDVKDQIEFETSPIVLKFWVRDAEELLTSTSGDSIGFYFLSNRNRGKYNTFNAVMCETNKSSEYVVSNLKLTFLANVNRPGVSLGLNNTNDRRDNYRKRGLFLKGRSNDFETEQTGIHYNKIATPKTAKNGFEDFINILKSKGKDRFFSIVVKNETSTTLVHTDMLIPSRSTLQDIVKLSKGYDLYDHGTGCCPIP